MALFRPISITEAIQATPYPPARSIVIAYPGLKDWFRLYKPSRATIPSDVWDPTWHQSVFENMKRDHENQVKKQLDLINSFETGRAVLAETNARPSFSVMIFPFDFIPTDKWSVTNEEVTKATTMPFTETDRFRWRLRHDFFPFDQTPPPPLQPEIAARLKGSAPFCTNIGRNTMCFATSGTGSSVDMFFTPRRVRGLQTADEALLHELVHASRIVKGLWNAAPMDGDYGNQEEFLAVVVADIYRSQKQRPPLSYHDHPIDTASFLNPTRRKFLLLMRSHQRELFWRLANVKTNFNPIQQVNAESPE